MESELGGTLKPGPAVVLVRPREEGNVGAAARAMANMGLSRLILVEPATELGGVARGFGVGAWPLLDSVRREASLASAVSPFTRLFGTTSARGRQLGETPVLTAREMAQELSCDPWPERCALIFGPERSGLSRDELSLCGQLVRIPTAAAVPTLNLAQAVLVLAYEIQATGWSAPPPPRSPSLARASAEELDRLVGHATRVLEHLGPWDDSARAANLRLLRRLAARGRASNREVRALRKLCRRLERALSGASDRLPPSARTREGDPPV